MKRVIEAVSPEETTEPDNGSPERGAMGSMDRMHLKIN